MFEDLIVCSARFSLVEVVHVELADERREVVVLEVLRQDLLAEGVRVLDCEAVTIRLSPRHDVVLRLVVHNLVQLDQKGWHVVDGRYSCVTIVDACVEIRSCTVSLEGRLIRRWCHGAWLLLGLYDGLVLLTNWRHSGLKDLLLVGLLRLPDTQRL